MSSDSPYTEFAEYPEINDAQKQVLRAIGLALMGVQGVESKLKFILSFVFPDREDATLAELRSQDGKLTKATLGRLICRLRERAEVSPQFEKQLAAFLQLRNRFVHGLLMERGYTPSTDENIARLQNFLSDLEFSAWHIDAVLMGYVLLLTKALGIHEKLPHREGTYFRNLHKYFSPELRLKIDPKKAGTAGD